MVFLGKGYEFQYSFCYIFQRIFFGVIVDIGERCYVLFLIFMGIKRFFIRVYFFERGVFILFVFLLSELFWFFLFILMVYYVYLLFILVVLENCKFYFYVGFFCLEFFKKESSLLLIVGCLFCSFFFIWFSWKCILFGKGCF